MVDIEYPGGICFFIFAAEDFSVLFGHSSVFLIIEPVQK